MKTFGQVFRIVGLFGLAFCFSVGIAVVCVHADTLELVSGNGSVGSADPITSYSTNGGGSFSSAIIISPVFNYDTIPGTGWISVNSSGYGPTYTDILFRTTFTLPAGFSSPSLSVMVHADNVASVYLNGTWIGAQTNAETMINFQDPAQVFSNSNAALFLAGANVLDFDVWNGNNPLGLDYKTTVTFVPEPTTGLLVIMSLCGLSAVSKRRLSGSNH